MFCKKLLCCNLHPAVRLLHREYIDKTPSLTTFTPQSSINTSKKSILRANLNSWIYNYYPPTSFKHQSVSNIDPLTRPQKHSTLYPAIHSQYSEQDLIVMIMAQDFLFCCILQWPPVHSLVDISVRPDHHHQFQLCHCHHNIACHDHNAFIIFSYCCGCEPPFHRYEARTGSAKF